MILPNATALLWSVTVGVFTIFAVNNREKVNLRMNQSGMTVVQILTCSGHGAVFGKRRNCELRLFPLVPEPFQICEVRCTIRSDAPVQRHNAN